MAHIPHGSTFLEVMAAIALILVVSALFILALNPGALLSKYRDNERLEDARKIAEAMVFYRMENPDGFEDFIKPADGKRVMLASDSACTPHYGSQCKASIMSTACLSLIPLQSKYLTLLPKERNILKEEPATGFYAEMSGEMLKIGACAPDLRQTVEMTVDFRALQ